MPKIVLTDVTKRWGNFYAVDHLNLTIDDHSFVTLLGPSGCGKTTTLRMIAGLETPTSGRIAIGDTVVFDSERGINIPANRRRVGFLFQNYALWPNMTVYQNISFGLTNVKEQLPVTYWDVRRCSRIAEMLDRWSEVVALILDCRDKKGNIDEARARVLLIDTFSVSMFAAKEVFSFGLHRESDPAAKAASLAAEYRRKGKALRASLAERGIELNENGEAIRDGKPVTALRRLTREEIDLTVFRVARIVKIGMFMDRYPAELSGGQQQRVAIARTLAPQPSVLFMDEPLSNLDAKLRLEMRSELQRLHLTTGSTFVYVTHDQMEAMTLATRICLIDNGVLQQYDRPLDVYSRPCNLFVADFVGNPAINFMEAQGEQHPDGTLSLSVLDGETVRFCFAEATDVRRFAQEDRQREAAEEAARQTARADRKNVEKGNKDKAFRYRIVRVDDTPEREAPVTDRDYVLGIRPEALALSGTGSLTGEIYSAMPTGMETTVRVRLGQYLLTGVVFGGITYTIGQKVAISFKGDGVMLFSRKSGRLIGTGTLELQASPDAVAAAGTDDNEH